jgi:hypothetical protein
LAEKFKTVPVRVPANAPYLPPSVTQEQAWAIKALMEGRASEAEQGVALRFILHVLCEVDAMTYRPDERDHVFADGKRFVGHQIARICRMGPDVITKLPRLAFSPAGLEDDEMPTN